jgi:uncharacterized protein YunC (DUF1805 family)
MNELQLNLTIANQQEIKRSWAFAVDPAKPRRKSLRNINRCVITAVSREAKAFGVKAGMAAAEARLLMPELKVFVCNWR